MKTTDSAPHKYLLPYNVNYRAPFRFDAKYGTLVCTYTPQPPGNPLITWGANSSRGYTDKECRNNVESGEWLVLDEQPASFRFFCKDTPEYTYMYVRDKGTQWEGGNGIDYSYCTQDFARNAVANGAWTLLPSEHPESAANILSTQTEAEAESAAFSATNSLVKPASKASDVTLDVYKVGSLMHTKVNLPSGSSKETIKVVQDMIANFNNAPQQPLLETIKNACITSKGRIAVTIYPDHYEVYHRPLFEDCLSVDEKELGVFLASLLVIDRSGNWDY